jgi:hypothetical protein
MTLVQLLGSIQRVLEVVHNHRDDRYRRRQMKFGVKLVQRLGVQLVCALQRLDPMRCKRAEAAVSVVRLVNMDAVKAKPKSAVKPIIGPFAA